MIFLEHHTIPHDWRGGSRDSRQSRLSLPWPTAGPALGLRRQGLSSIPIPVPRTLPAAQNFVSVPFRQSRLSPRIRSHSLPPPLGNLSLFLLPPPDEVFPRVCLTVFISHSLLHPNHSYQTWLTFWALPEGLRSLLQG